MSSQGSLTNASFLASYHAALEECREIVAQHSDDGENDLISLWQMFPHGSQDILFMIFTKACRALGYAAKGNLIKVADEARDIVNYGAFLVVFIEKEMQKC